MSQRLANFPPVTINYIDLWAFASSNRQNLRNNIHYLVTSSFVHWCKFLVQPMQRQLADRWARIRYLE